ncbi:MAG: mechanosensitive ion channel family protein [Planctomycetota bacterium]
MQRGVRLSIERLIHYAVICIGFLLVISIIGFDLTKFTILISALGVGIGFGLQGVVNNFVSGLILLFEQPVRQGDIVEVAGVWAEVKNIGLRATTVRTFDQADLIIPNADLTTNQVTNWTLSSRQVRLIIPVGVAYGSDVPLVFEILTECAQANEKVAKTPEPVVLFLKFGESSLDFELRVWIIDTDYRLRVRSQLHQEIDRRFREANIVIAFPQRDVHLQTPNESAVSESLRADT